MERFVCVHGHFYQPPRESPWLEAIEVQPSAYPFHDWNERITAECYEPNAAARVLGEDGRIERLVNNYARISFDVGPTLLRWLEQRAPAVYGAILDGDRRAAERYGGHGAAMAQAYHHSILPLANERDRRTEIVWGLHDFVTRFRREPEGMWLAEAAVDTPTLELLAEHGVRFVVLSPYQARRVRAVGSRAWTDVSDGSVTTTVPYRAVLPSGRQLALFFYDGPRSRAVAFEGLLESGERFADRLLGGFADGDGPQLVHVATDGESYGHHHRHGEMALAFALRRIESLPDVSLTTYGQFLERFPPRHEAEIVEASSWSCAHGVERWRADCGCTTVQPPGWTQAWRAPLRAALDQLRDDLVTPYELAAAELLRDPWGARDDYVRVVTRRTPATVDAFLDEHAIRPLDAPGRARALQLLELQRHALMMFTSCGWFFEELSRIETVQVLQYAARAIQLAERLFDAGGLEEQFLQGLEKAPSNEDAYAHGREVYERRVRPAIVHLDQVAAHAAISGLFGHPRRREQVYGYAVERRDATASEAGRARLGSARLVVQSSITRVSREFEYAVVHLGDHNVVCGVRQADGFATSLEEVTDGLLEAFTKADLPEVIRRIDDAFEGRRYSLASLFRDEQNRILRTILDTTMSEVESTYRNLYRSRAPLMRYLTDLGQHPPEALRRATEVVLNADLREAVRHAEVDVAHVDALLVEAQRYGVELDRAGLGHELTSTIERVAQQIPQLLAQPTLFESFGEEEAAFFDRIEALVDLAARLPFEVDLWQAQNVYYRAHRDHVPQLVSRSSAGDASARQWIERFDALGERLNFAPLS